MRVTGVGDADGISDAPAGCILLQAELTVLVIHVRLAKLHYALQRIWRVLNSQPSFLGNPCSGPERLDGATYDFCPPNADEYAKNYMPLDGIFPG